MRPHTSILVLLAALWGVAGSTGALAQVAPTAAQAAQYTGLLGAAHRGDLAKLRSLLAANPALEVRDPQQRTPLHVATHARQRDAIRLLAAAGADLNALEYQQYLSLIHI